MLENLNKIQLKNPVDLIISQIKDLISEGQIKPGEKLPPERKLAEHLGVSRNQVRAAIAKLEFYGILKVLPQSGTVVSGLGVSALEGLMTDILKIEKPDFRSLVETRVLLEKEAARLAAIHHTREDIIQINNALLAYEDKVNAGQSAIEDDLMFHIKIAEASKNTVLRTFMMIITPDIVKSFINLGVCDDNRTQRTIKEHREIYRYILESKPDEASKAMELHLDEVLTFSKTNEILI
ncbi:MAG: FadR family transcriptional regulator [Bacteroidia bacterium]|nr:FadR family transcriptional regulator [Bacteroidia bacterium]